MHPIISATVDDTAVAEGAAEKADKATSLQIGKPPHSHLDRPLIP